VHTTKVRHASRRRQGWRGSRAPKVPTAFDAPRQAEEAWGSPQDQAEVAQVTSGLTSNSTAPGRIAPARKSGKYLAGKNIPKIAVGVTWLWAAFLHRGIAHTVKLRSELRRPPLACIAARCCIRRRRRRKTRRSAGSCSWAWCSPAAPPRSRRGADGAIVVRQWDRIRTSNDPARARSAPRSSMLGNPPFGCVAPSAEL
jgi:hypothetical protein